MLSLADRAGLATPDDELAGWTLVFGRWIHGRRLAFKERRNLWLLYERRHVHFLHTVGRWRAPYSCIMCRPLIAGLVLLVIVAVLWSSGRFSGYANYLRYSTFAGDADQWNVSPPISVINIYRQETTSRPARPIMSQIVIVGNGQPLGPGAFADVTGGKALADRTISAPWQTLGHVQLKLKSPMPINAVTVKDDSNAPSIFRVVLEEPSEREHGEAKTIMGEEVFMWKNGKLQSASTSVGA
jgi:hypothetical protein